MYQSPKEGELRALMILSSVNVENIFTTTKNSGKQIFVRILF